MVPCRQYFIWLLCLSFGLSSYLPLRSQQPDYALFDHLLSGINHEGHIDYARLKAQPETLMRFLESLRQHTPEEHWSSQQRMAYWINTYNAYTLYVVQEGYPTGSIKDIPGAWKKKIIPFNGRMLSLDQVEHEILRPMGDPRVHFAINCASASCPPLQHTAFRPELLNQQLEEATSAFIRNPLHNTLEPGQVEISRIFQWFSTDFKPAGGIIPFLNRYSETEIAPTARIRYKPYSWQLNE